MSVAIGSMSYAYLFKCSRPGFLWKIDRKIGTPKMETPCKSRKDHSLRIQVCPKTLAFLFFSDGFQSYSIGRGLDSEGRLMYPIYEPPPHTHLSNGNKPFMTSHYTGWFIGILILAYYNPYEIVPLHCFMGFLVDEGDALEDNHGKSSPTWKKRL